VHSSQLHSLYNPRHPASARPSENSGTTNYSLQNQYEVPHPVRYGPVYNDQMHPYPFARTQAKQHGHPY
jgi:hypothetical protein